MTQEALFPELAQDPPTVLPEETVRAFCLQQQPDREIASVQRADFEKTCKRCGVIDRPWIVVFADWQHHAGMYCSHDLHLLDWLRKPENLRRRVQVPDGLRLRVFQRDGFRCVYCRRHRDQLKSGEFLHADHVVPVANGGETTLENLACACSPCNAGKGASKLDREAT